MMHAIRQIPPRPIEPVAPPFHRAPLAAAVLSDRPSRLMAALADQSIAAQDATSGDLALLLRDAPDMLIIDLDPDQMPNRRIALLIQQLAWLRRDLVIAVSRRTAPKARGFAIDLIFDAEGCDDTLAFSLRECARLLTLSRLRPAEADAPRAALLQHRPARRAQLFG